MSAITFTVRVVDALFPAASLTLYVTVYVPGVFVFTVPDVTILDVKSPSILSVAVAPSSL